MSEAEILEQLQLVRTNIGFVASEIIAVHFALIVGIFYFLNHARLPLKVGSFVVYAFGYAGLLGLYLWETAHLSGLVQNLLAIKERAGLAPASEYILSWTMGAGAIMDLLAWIAFGLMFAVVTYLLFFYHVGTNPSDETQKRIVPPAEPIEQSGTN